MSDEIEAEEMAYDRGYEAGKDEAARLTYAAVVDWLAAQGDERAMCNAADKLLRDARNQRKV